VAEALHEELAAMTGSITQEEFDLLTKMECEIAAELASQG
jgi:hypothetical protein